MLSYEIGSGNKAFFFEPISFSCYNFYSSVKNATSYSHVVEHSRNRSESTKRSVLSTNTGDFFHK